MMTLQAVVTIFHSPPPNAGTPSDHSTHQHCMLGASSCLGPLILEGLDRWSIRQDVDKSIIHITTTPFPAASANTFPPSRVHHLPIQPLAFTHHQHTNTAAVQWH